MFQGSIILLLKKSKISNQGREFKTYRKRRDKKGEEKMERKREGGRKNREKRKERKEEKKLKLDFKK